MPNPRIEPLKKVLTIDPNDEVAWFGLGKAYMEDANFEEAAKALQRIWSGAGVIAGASGRRYEQYRTVHSV